MYVKVKLACAIYTVIQYSFIKPFSALRYEDEKQLEKVSPNFNLEAPWLKITFTKYSNDLTFLLT